MEHSAIPIVFNHRMAPDSYLVASVLQARLTNPQSPVVLLHDFSEVPAELLAHRVQCLKIHDYYGECAKLDQIWFNISRNRAEFELGSIQRWMILRNFMRAYHLKSCFAADSDLLIYSDISSAHRNFNSCDFTVSGTGWSCAYFNKLAVLDRFHDFLLEVYERKTSLWWKVLDSINVMKTTIPIENLADTTLIKIFLTEIAAKEGFSFRNTAEIVEDSVFCPDIRSDLIPCEMEEHQEDPADSRSLRKLCWQNGVPYGRQTLTGRLIRMNVLHFRGNVKQYLLLNCFADFIASYAAPSQSQSQLVG